MFEPRPHLARFLALFRETALLMVGFPDYQRYVAHRQARHPGEAVMSRDAFVRERTLRRYDGRGPGRCC